MSSDLLNSALQLSDCIVSTPRFRLFRARLWPADRPVLAKALGRDSDAAHRVQAEFDFLRRLDIPGLVRPLEVVDSAEGSTLVLEPVSGASLLDLLDIAEPIDVGRALRIAIGIAEVLSGLHAAHRIGGDLRPAHWLVDPQSDSVHLIDVAASLPDMPTTPAPPPSVIADWASLAPEQTGRVSLSVDARADLYVLGFLMYRMLCGQPPFEGRDPLEWAHCHLARIPVPPAVVVPSVPQVLSAIVVRLLSKLPEDRYQSAQSLLFDLRRCAAQWAAAERIDAFGLGSGDLPETLRVPGTIYGREREFRELLGTFHTVVESGRMTVVDVSGPEGIGKSTLIAALRDPVTRAGGVFVVGRFEPHQLDIPYVALARALRSLLQRILGDSAEELVAWRDRILAAVGRCGRLICELLPQLELVIGVPPAVEPLPATEAQTRFRHVFGRFVEALARPERPLVLFLDEAQWIDEASLQLLVSLCRAATSGLLLIVAYRPPVPGAPHPLQAMHDVLRDGGVDHARQPLGPVSFDAMHTLVADTLRMPLPECESLARALYERSQGVPLPFVQRLESLYRDGLLQHGGEQGGWRWDPLRVAAVGYTDDAADRVATRLQGLPEATDRALQRAACLGVEFELPLLAAALGASELEVEQALVPAIAGSLVAVVDGGYKFLHERIQKAAYGRIAEGEHATVHVAMGRALRDRLTPDQLATHIFDVAHQFRCGAAMILDSGERETVARIELQAGLLAKASGARAAARAHFSSAMALVGDAVAKDGARLQDLRATLWLECAEADFMAGDLDRADRLLEQLSSWPDGRARMAAAGRVKVLLRVMRSENAQAIDDAAACLRQFGIEAPPHPSEAQVREEFEQVWRRLGDRPIEQLEALPACAEEDLHPLMQLLSVLLGPAYFTDFRLYCLYLGKMVNLSLERGTTAASAHAYAFFGVVLGPTFGRYDEGERFARVACALSQRQEYNQNRAAVHYAMGIVCSWTQPMDAAIEFMRQASLFAIDSGDLPFACYSRSQMVTFRRMRGDSLSEVAREAEDAREHAIRARFRDAADILVGELQFVAAMQGRTSALGSFDAPGFNEADFESRLGDDRMSTMSCFYWILRLQALVVAGEFDAALRCAGRAKSLLWATSAMPQVTDYGVATAVAAAALYDTASAERRHELRALVQQQQAELRECAAVNPASFDDKQLLAVAELARIDGDTLLALQQYDRAVQAACDAGRAPLEALACERAAGFHLATGLEGTGRALLVRAYRAYARWGAAGKVRELERRHPGLAHASGAVDDRGTGPGVDAEAIVRSMQAISGLIVMDELIETLLRLVLEHAGAQSAVLLLVRRGELAPVAHARVRDRSIEVRLTGEAPMSAATLPVSVVNYVRRSRKAVLLDAASIDSPFAGDTYLSRERPRSLLCLPIVRQSTLQGVLVLEHQTLAGVFHPGRVSVLDLLASQAAIALENALLYGDLQREEVELRRAHSALRASEARFRRVFESNMIGIAFWTADGRIIDANAAFVDLLGYHAQDVREGRLSWASLTAAEWQAARQVVLRDGISKPTETELLASDGDRIPVLIGGALIDGGRESGVAFVLDLRTRRQAEAERRARAVAEAANRAKSEFLANMSHELRTPLNAVLGYAQILRRSKNLDARQLAGLDVIQQSGMHLLTLINDILDSAKIESGNQELVLVDFSLTAFLPAIVDVIRVKAEAKGLQLVCNFSPNLPDMVRGDQRRLRQVLLNLLANAVKFTERGRVELRVEKLAQSQLCFEVRDTGIGIAQDALQSIFVPFAQVGDVRRRFGGTGLGLSISRQCVRLMGGDIEVESHPGQGSVFRFTVDLPMVSGLPSPQAVERVIGYAGARKRVLIVDDLAENRAVLRDLLSEIGFDFDEANNGREALQLVASKRPDLVLMDAVMPEMDGVEAIRRLRQTEQSTELPVIMVSASVSDSDADSYLAAGANAFVAKPVDESQLLDHIGRLLNVEWIRESDAAAAPPLSAAPPAVPAREQLQVLHRLALMGSMREIIDSATQLAESDERYRRFADHVLSLASRYQSKAILTFVEQHLDSSRH